MPANKVLQSDTCEQAPFGYANPRPLASAAELWRYGKLGSDCHCYRDKSHDCS